jgi:hypothetical protein
MAEWSSAYVTALPDSAFACVDSEGRHYPHHNAQGKLDLPHLNAALSRVADPSNTQCGKGHLQAHRKTEGIGQKTDYLKAEQIGTAKWRVLAIPFGGPLKGGKDLDGEYFSPRTDIKPHWFKERPVIFHHGQDPELGDSDVGIQGDLVQEKDGWWAPIWLERQNQYFARLNQLIAAGKMYGSSGSMPHLIKMDRSTGEILVWPHVEQTLTFTPANAFARVTASKALDDFTSAGIELDPAIRGILSDLDTLTTDLESDLPSGGGDPAMARLSSTLDQLDEALRLVT